MAQDGRPATPPARRADPEADPAQAGGAAARPDLYAVALDDPAVRRAALENPARLEALAQRKERRQARNAERAALVAVPRPDANRDAADRNAAHRAALATRQARRKERRLVRVEARAAALAAVPPMTLPAPDVGPARPRARHYAVLASFLVLVVAPFLLGAVYLYTRAADQYHSNVAFSIRSEEMGSAAAGILGAITQIGSGTASDTDILFEFIRSQKIVEEIDAELDLRALYNAAGGDPVFTLGDDPSIEALHAHWLDMTDVSFETSAGIIQVRANAFSAEDARAIAAAILERSGALVNQLSEQAREDAIRFAREELAEAEDNLRLVRERLADFRRENRIVDPSADVAGQMGLLNALQSELAGALVDRDVLLSFVDETDQRVIQGGRRIDAITARIEEERDTLDRAGAEGSLPDMVGAYEELLVDLEFASTAYTQALAGLAAARAEARRQSRYLAPHIEPTLAQSPLYPRRAQIAGLIGLFLALGWGVVMLVAYNMRDNR